MSNPQPSAPVVVPAEQQAVVSPARLPIGPVALLAAGMGIVLFLVGRDIGFAQSLAFSGDGLLNVGQVLAPLIAVALFIERAVEVVITAWRAQGSRERQWSVDHPRDEQSARFARMALDRYRMSTQRYSFIVSLSLSVFAALVGVRAVGPLLAAGALDALQGGQQLWFAAFDVGITGLLLAGGADGIHQVVTTLTKFLDTTKAKMDAPAQPGGAANGNG
ncbi:MAG TPA: hypothetical protein VF746_16565 [Longimicrobium sp.]|jgi:hypothetical protein